MTFEPPWLVLLGAAALSLISAAVALLRQPSQQRALWVAQGGPAEAAAARRTPRMRVRWLPDALHVLALLLLFVALARPRQGLALSVIPEEGIDVVVALDTSSSMTERIVGASETKLAAAQRVVREFARSLEGDRVGLVIFQSRALTMSPLTVDQPAIGRGVSNVRSGLLPDGTAIGLGLAESLNLLRDSTARSRIVVLLTDGQNNGGEITPGAATALARALEIRVYTIGFGAGRPGSVDATALGQIAEATGGRFFDAATTADLAEAYAEVGRLERSVVGERRFTRYREFAPVLAAIALSALVIEAALRSTWLRRHP